MFLPEWLNKEQVGNWARKMFRLWLTQEGHNPNIERDETEWAALWAKFVEWNNKAD